MAPGRSRTRFSDSFVEQWSPLVNAIATGIAQSLPPEAIVDRDDLLHIGLIALFEVLPRFDPSLGRTLGQFARKRVRGAMLDHLRQLDPMTRDSRRKLKQVAGFVEAFEARHGRAPFYAEVREALGLDPSDVLQPQLVSMNAPRAEALHISDFVASTDPDPEKLADRAQLRLKLAGVLDRLKPRYRQVLELYYFAELTMKEVGRRMSVNESRVSQIHSAALSQCRQFFQETPRPPADSCTSSTRGTTLRFPLAA